MHIVIAIFVLKTNGPATSHSTSLGVKFIYLFFLQRIFLLMAFSCLAYRFYLLSLLKKGKHSLLHNRT